ncbi:hypothetical protein CCH79_00018860 [Gambusia affinis]|uniref:Uncharacterized protein n=1 Tax=Gambusia affinis TaxID=33528 RepID=A0A315VF08_GAMAF|nr:hypothetical protein CCH79_00018860 [Gambusia affinis]
MVAVKERVAGWRSGRVGNSRPRGPVSCDFEMFLYFNTPESNNEVISRTLENLTALGRGSVGLTEVLRAKSDSGGDGGRGHRGEGDPSPSGHNRVSRHTAGLVVNIGTDRIIWKAIVTERNLLTYERNGGQGIKGMGKATINSAAGPSFLRDRNCSGCPDPTRCFRSRCRSRLETGKGTLSSGARPPVEVRATVSRLSERVGLLEEMSLFVVIGLGINLGLGAEPSTSLTEPGGRVHRCEHVKRPAVCSFEKQNRGCCDRGGIPESRGVTYLWEGRQANWAEYESQDQGDIVDFRRRKRDIQTLNICGEPVERVSNFCFLGVHIMDNLVWDVNTTELQNWPRRDYFLESPQKQQYFSKTAGILSIIY